ncbi:ATP-binding protein [Ramlibacter tataouinensis]|uniref:ATP-binding protein n=1 Tax=Ramlibacter tataouinensis TaxID=94132 RepID=UPI0022F3D063|nr:ATP-binding protein [Ramlibacter tataouinensis]WBY02322.1 ATP-binding protein [Ramlibacter tataouinensis]
MKETTGLPQSNDSHCTAAGVSLLAGSTAKAEAIAESDMAALVSGHDWASTPLGPAEQWPQSLKSAVRLMLASRYPMFICWGPQLTSLYNDAYVAFLGPRHPWALGSSARETWADIWHVVGPQVDSAMQRGAATWNDRVLLVMHRKGFAEETYFTFSFSPCFDDSGEVGGVYCACTDETDRVLGDRRLKSLAALAAAVQDSHNPREACEAAARTLAGNPHDLPFVLLYLQEGDSARLAARCGVDDARLAVPQVALAAPEGPWPLAAVAARREPAVVAGVTAHAEVTAGPWPEPVEDAIVLPLPASAPGAPAGFMVAGLNPRRPLDGDYRDYLGLLAQRVASAIADARSFEAEQQRARSLAELDRAKTLFFSNVSHELRTPLALVLGPVSDLLEGGAVSGPARDALRLAQRNGHRLQRLVNTLLEFSRFEGGRVQARFRPLDLGAHTAGLAAFFQSAATRAGLALHIRCEPLPEPVYVDRSLWEKIVFNLVSNAIKYTLVGQVVVRLKPTPTGARLEVLDTGVGIPEEALPRVFERFYRVEGAHGRSIEGTGIGLALVAELVRLHGGTVQVQSRLGEGSTFTVDLPWGSAHLDPGQVEQAGEAAPATEPPRGWLDEVEGWIDHTAAEPLPADFAFAPALPPQPPAAGHRPRVLVADDNADMRAYLAQLVGHEHEVQVVGDGWQALRAIDEWMPDLVVTDASMPGLDGFGLLQRLRADPGTAALPVVMLSARAGHGARLQALEAGADDFLVKPFHARELLARLSATLRLAQVRREAMEREQALRAEVQEVLESVTDSFVVVDRDWLFTYVNGAAEAVFGRSRESMLGRSYWELFPKARGSVFEEPLLRAMREREPTTVDGPIDPMAGWFEASIYPVASGGLACSFRDVLQTRLLERSIRESEAQQRFLADFGGLMQRIEDPEAVLDAAVRALAEYLRADRCTWVLFDEDEDSFEIRGEFRREGLTSSLGRLRLRDFGGEQLRLYRAALPFVVHDIAGDARIDAAQRDAFRLMGAGAHASFGILRAGRLVAGIGVQQCTARRWSESEVVLLQAATQRCWEAFERAQVQRRQREAAEALAQALAALQQVERRKDQFIATLAHELRNPLAPLRNGVQLLELGGGPDSGARVQAMMRRQIDHLVRLVDDLLEVSRITSGKVVLQRGRMSLHELLAGAVESCRPVLDAARHSLHVDIGAVAAVEVDGDPLRLGQVFANLLNNSAKYTDPGGHVALTARTDGAQAVVQVQDNGMGLPPEMLEEVFQPFVQADRSAARAQGGLGIGLSIVRSLVELHGGVVFAQSDGPGKGSTFEVRIPVLPAQQGEAPAPAADPAAPPVQPEGPSVLVVDDNRDAADSLGAMLEMMGATTRVVYGGPDALAAAQEQPPQLVLLDLGMPGMDGYEVVRRLAGHPRRDRMHVVALTGWGQAEDRQRTREAGFDEHLVKPADIDTLQALLGRVGSAVAG